MVELDTMTVTQEEVAVVPTPIACPRCKTTTNFNIQTTVDQTHRGATRLAIGSCQVCEYPVYFGLNKDNNNRVWHYPEVVETPPEGLPELVKRAFAEAMLCASAEAPNGALLMCRRAIQEAMNDKNAKKGDLPVQLQDLVDRRIITPSLQQWATHAQIAGRIAAHGTGGDKWGDPNQVWGTQDDAKAVVNFCKAFFEYLYTLEQRNQQFIAKHQPASQSGPGSNAP